VIAVRETVDHLLGGLLRLGAEVLATLVIANHEALGRHVDTPQSVLDHRTPAGGGGRTNRGAYFASLDLSKTFTATGGQRRLDLQDGHNARTFKTG
jgi:hypothetical protein